MRLLSLIRVKLHKGAVYSSVLSIVPNLQSDERTPSQLRTYVGSILASSSLGGELGIGIYVGCDNMSLVTLLYHPITAK